MFVRALHTGSLDQALRRAAVMRGLALEEPCVAVALNGVDLMHFAVAPARARRRWNFLFVGGTTLFTSSLPAGEKTTRSGEWTRSSRTMTVTSFTRRAGHHPGRALLNLDRSCRWRDRRCALWFAARNARRCAAGRPSLRVRLLARAEPATTRSGTAGTRSAVPERAPGANSLSRIALGRRMSGLRIQRSSRRDGRCRPSSSASPGGRRSRSASTGPRPNRARAPRAALPPTSIRSP
jgi:hypothetical protein